MAENQQQEANAIAQVVAQAATAAVKEVTKVTKEIIDELRAGKEADKDKNAIGLPSWEVDPGHASAVVVPWPGATYSIPADIVELVRKGVRPPLIWLTVEAFVGAEDRETRKTLTFPLNAKQQERINDAYRKNNFLPRGPTHQAIQALATICRAVAPPAAEANKSHANILEDLHVEIMTRAADIHWPVWRRYIKQTLEAMWAKREPGVGMAFDVGAINADMVRKAERQCGKPPGFMDDFTGIGETWVAELLKAEGDDINRIGKAMEDAQKPAIFNVPAAVPAPVHLSSGPATPKRQNQTSHSYQGEGSSHGTGKRRHRDWDDNNKPFRRAPPSSSGRDGGASVPTGPRDDSSGRPALEFCTACLRQTDHDFKNYPQPHSPSLENISRLGWRWKGKPLVFCHRFNCGKECLPEIGRCSFGHYCSKCGTDGH
ncbi:hypothetical protein A4X03_0g9417, partial [Tilletia caries]